MESIWTIVITAAVSVIATLGTTWFGHWLGLSKDRVLRDEELERNARYLAIRVVCVLDPFVSSCVEVANDTGAAAPPEGEFEPNATLPKLILPGDVDWRVLEPDIMYRILGLPNEIAIADHSIGFVGSEVSNPPHHSEYFWERSIRYAELGLRTKQLADDLRSRYEIPTQIYVGWDPRESLELRLSSVKKQKSEHDSRQAASTRLLLEGYAARKGTAVTEATKERKSS